MSFAKPAFLEVLLEQVIGHWLLSPFYRSFVKNVRISGDECILEFGCGGGNLSRHLARALRKKGVLACLDTSEYWLGRAQRRLKHYTNTRFIGCDIRTHPVPAGAMDIVVIHYVLHDIEEPKQPGVVRALANTLRPGGCFCIREPMSERHGIQPEAVRALMTDAGLKESGAVVVRKVLSGSVFEGVYVRRGA